MALIDPPAFHGLAANSYTADRLRRTLQTMLADREGVLTAVDLVVRPNSPAAMNVVIGPGRAFVAGDSVIRQGVYMVENDADTVSPTFTAADPTNPRIDLLVLRDYDQAPDGGSAAADEARFDIVQGTPAATPAAPALPANAIPLAQVRVNAGQSTITASSITDVRPFAGFGGELGNLLGNPYMNDWSRGTSAAPDAWTLTGTSAAVAQDTTNIDGGHQYAAALTNGASQTASLVQRLSPTSGTDGPAVSWRGRLVTFTARVRAGTSNRVRLQLSDGTTPVYSAYHSGGGTYETLTVTMMVPTTASNNLTCAITIDTGTAITVQIVKAAAVFGPTAKIPAPTHPALDDVRSGRFFETVQEYGRIYSSDNAGVRVAVQYMTRKAGTPTITVRGGGTYLGVATAASVSPLGVTGVAGGVTTSGVGVANWDHVYDAVV